MPTYAFECPQCEEAFEKILPLAEYNDPQECPACGEEARRVITPVGFILKGDGWPGKNLKIKGQMNRKREKLGTKSREKAREEPDLKLVPNVEGERTESWADAKKLAASKGKDTTSFDPLVREERG